MENIIFVLDVVIVVVIWRMIVEMKYLRINYRHFSRVILELPSRAMHLVDYCITEVDTLTSEKRTPFCPCAAL